MRIFDGFTFHSEFDILELRLTELYDAVDHFVLVEADRTFTGAPKPLHFLENRERFAPWLDKIIHVPVTDFPETDSPWTREAFQRDAIARGLKGCDPLDMVLLSDVDEIPRASVVRSLRQTEAWIVGLRMGLFYYRLNHRNVAGEPHEVWALAVRGDLLTSSTPQQLRLLRLSLRGVDPAAPPPGIAVLDHAGWHFSYIGDDEAVREKIRAFSHQEFNRPEILDAIDVNAMLASGRDLFGRPGFVWQSVGVDDYFPRALRADPARWAPHIAPNGAGFVAWDRAWAE